MEAEFEADELYQPCSNLPIGLLDLELLQDYAGIVSEQAPNRTKGGSGQSEYQLYCICLQLSRVDDLLAGEAKRGGCSLNIQYRPKCRFDPEYPTVHSYSDHIVYHCNRGPADHSTEQPEVVDPKQRPKHGPGSYRSKIKNGESVKVGCKVHFSVRQPVLAPGVAVVKWRVGSTQHAGHGTAAHTATLGLADQFPSRLSDECRTWAAGRLLNDVPLGTILEV